MKPLRPGSLRLVLLLAAVSAALYGVQFLLFGSPKEIAFGLWSNLAFLPVYVLFVTLMIERILKEREKLALREKLNMVIGVFFSEVGTALLRDLLRCLNNREQFTQHLHSLAQWKDDDFKQAMERVRTFEADLDDGLCDLEMLKQHLSSHRDILLALLANPNLLEHDDFTDLLWAVFHFSEELNARHDLSTLSAHDLEHLCIDIKRVFTHLVVQWLAYMQHLKNNYPYLFSLAIRTNPADPSAQVEVQ